MSGHLSQTAREIAAAQHGVIATYQLRQRGTADAVRHELRRQRWTHVHDGVAQLLGSPSTDVSIAMAKLLRGGPGAVISGDSALALWGLPGHRLDPLHICRIRGSNGKKLRTEGIIVHESRRMPPHHVTTLDGFPLVTPARALADVSATEHPMRLERWLDRAWGRRLVDYQSMITVVNDLTKRGRRGIPALRELVAARGPTYVAPESGLESRVNQLLEELRLPEVIRQANVGGGEWLARVDFRIGATPLLIEVQSDAFHAALTSQEDDRRRIQCLEGQGFIVVEIFESEVWHRRDRFDAKIRDGMHRAGLNVPTASVRRRSSAV